MLLAILNKFWRHHPQSSSCTVIYHPSLKLSKLDQLCMCDTAEELGTNSKVTFSCGPLHMAKARRLAKTYLQQLCADTSSSLEDLPGAMDDRGGWRKRVDMTMMMMMIGAMRNANSHDQIWIRVAKSISYDDNRSATNVFFQGPHNQS